MFPHFFSDLTPPIAIVGLGVTGQATLDLLTSVGIPKDSILTFDEKAPTAHFSRGESLLKEGKPNTLIVSPGVPLESSWLKEARRNGIPIHSELSLASRLLTSERVIAITGSVGKSTTTCLLGAALAKFCPSYFVGGNLGTPLAVYLRDLLAGKRSKAEWIVLELSSYQLENFPNLNAEISIVTYLTSNHLERYSNKDEYFQTKWNIQNYTSVGLILNKNGGELESWAKNHPPKGATFWTDRHSDLLVQFNLAQCQLLGSHNLDNIALAAEAIRLCGWPVTAYDGLREFPGLPHRVENLGCKNKIRFVNDSKATTMESVKIAVQSTLEAIPSRAHLHLLLGGKDKNLPWNELHDLKNIATLKFYFFGECRALAKAKSALNGELYRSLQEACSAAYSTAKAGDILLLSPGGTSLDEFKNFEQRGEAFRTFFNSLS